MAMTSCKECKAQISTNAESCPLCGAKRKKTSGCALIIASLLALVFLSAITRGCSGEPTQPHPAANQSPANDSSATQEQSAPVEAVERDPAEIYAEWNRALDRIESRLKSNANHLKKYYGTADQLKETSSDLLMLQTLENTYPESAIKEERDLRIRASAIMSKVSEQRRVLYASAAEQIFVKGGIDVSVSANGAKKDQLRIKYVLMSKPLVYQFRNELKIDDQAKELGFKKVTFTDGFDESWTVSL